MFAYGGNKMKYIDDLNEKTILTRYSTYLEVLKKLGSYPLSKNITIDDLGTKQEVKAITQRCYRDMATDGLKIPAIEYLYWVSYQYLSYLTKKEYGEKDRKNENSQHVTICKMLKDFGIKFEGKGAVRDGLEYLAIHLIIFLNNSIKNRFNTKNLIRGFYKNERLYIGSVIASSVFETYIDFRLGRLSFFNLINALNFYEFEMELFDELGANPATDKNNLHYWNNYYRQIVENIVITKMPWVNTELDKHPVFRKLPNS